MTTDFGVSADIAKEKLHALTKTKKQQEQQAEQQQALLQKQAPSQATGLQWAIPQQQVQALNPSQKTQSADLKTKPAEPILATAEVEDIAVLSTTAVLRPEAVKAAERGPLTSFAAQIIDLNALQESFKEYYKKSKSHNLLLERFMSHIKFSGVKTLLSLLGISAAEQEQMQREVRDQALHEIDARLREDWAYTKAMLDITG